MFYRNRVETISKYRLKLGYFPVLLGPKLWSWKICSTGRRQSQVLLIVRSKSSPIYYRPTDCLCMFPALLIELIFGMGVSFDLSYAACFHGHRRLFFFLPRERTNSLLPSPILLPMSSSLSLLSLPPALS